MIDTRDVAIADLRPFDGNPRTHDLDTIAASLTANGQYRAIVVRDDMTILAGHGTVEAATALGWDTVTAHVVEATDDEAKRIVLVDNRSNDLANYDDELLLALLRSVDDLDGSGYLQADVRRIERILAASEADTGPRLGVTEYRVMVECDSEQHQAELLERFASEGLRTHAWVQ